VKIAQRIAVAVLAPLIAAGLLWFFGYDFDVNDGIGLALIVLALLFLLPLFWRNP